MQINIAQGRLFIKNIGDPLALLPPSKSVVTKSDISDRSLFFAGDEKTRFTSQPTIFDRDVLDLARKIILSFAIGRG